MDGRTASSPARIAAAALHPPRARARQARHTRSAVTRKKKPARAASQSIRLHTATPCGNGHLRCRQQIDPSALCGSHLAHDRKTDATAMLAGSRASSACTNGSKIRSMSAGATPGPASMQSMNSLSPSKGATARRISPPTGLDDGVRQEIRKRDAHLVRIETGLPANGGRS